MSINNPMKAEEQKLRISEHNPMKNKEIAEARSLELSTAVVINGQRFESSRKASEILGVHIETVRRWCSRGYDTNYQPCRYETETQKEYEIKKTCSKKVIIDDMYEFPSVKAAAEFCEGNSSNLIKALKNGRNYKGHRCSYVNQ